MSREALPAEQGRDCSTREDRFRDPASQGFPWYRLPDRNRHDRCVAYGVVDLTVSADAFDRERQRISALNARERDVIRLTGEGRTKSQIAQSLSLSQPAIDRALTSASQKLGTSDRFELIVLCYRHQLLRGPDSAVQGD